MPKSKALSLGQQSVQELEARVKRLFVKTPTQRALILW